MGSITAPENIPWFVSMWAWFGLLIWTELRKTSFTVLLATFFIVGFASMVPFFCRRVGCFASVCSFGLSPPFVLLWSLSFSEQFSTYHEFLGGFADTA